ncbi:uncharacterized protein LOC126908954 [Daktulosphaira vitifoliae]|uniref:uncharacterized protein LOC126908954 n=1 Tax=Daktulosphaira vitifoliae TaxID=58002 RepID=UPI0021AA5419|nr:uncharacterized protein LOC126908954 [Daktulosphaira vitifoliae]
MDRFLLNSHNRCVEEESIPSTSNSPTVKKRKYRKYDDSYLEFGFTSTEVNGEERPLCVLCMKVLAPECMLPSKLKRHLETNHKYAVGKSRDYFDRKRKELKQEKSIFFNNASIPNNALIASYKVAFRIAKCKKPHTIAEELILPAALDMVNIMIGESAGKLLSKVPLSNNTISRRIHHMADDLNDHGLKDFFYNFRNEGFESSKKIAQNLCEGLDIQAVFKQSRIKKKVRQFNYESKDARLNSAEQTFYDDYFLAVIDQAIVSINERFEQLSHHSEYFGFLYNIENLKTFDEETLRKHCMDLEILLKDGENNDINGIELFDELKIFCRILNKQMTSIECLNLIETTCGSFPNISIELRILLTLPITTASAERSFSKLKIIKNYLRTSMTQNRLSDLAIISIERDLCENLDYNDIIEKFAEIKARKIDFM